MYVYTFSNIIWFSIWFNLIILLRSNDESYTAQFISSTAATVQHLQQKKIQCVKIIDKLKGIV